ncbi:hypothetical protein BHM03_00060242 [Ensete ventricosum]|nr:hypothetical protein BHM03_00060242 [Ensete ventricosum]
MAGEVATVREAQRRCCARLKQVLETSLISDGAVVHGAREQGSEQWRQRRERAGRSSWAVGSSWRLRSGVGKQQRRQHQDERKIRRWDVVGSYNLRLEDNNNDSTR